MQNFQVIIDSSIYYIVFEQSNIGRIQYSDEERGFLVYPQGASYNGIFDSLEQAITELVFHSYSREKRPIPNC